MARLGDTRMPKRLMHSRIPSRASKGRPPKCWTDYVREDLDVPRLLHNWSWAAQDRVSRRDKFQYSLGTPGTMLEIVFD